MPWPDSQCVKKGCFMHIPIKDQFCFNNYIKRTQVGKFRSIRKKWSTCFMWIWTEALIRLRIRAIWRDASLFIFILYSFKISESMIGLPRSLIAYVDNRGSDQHRLIWASVVHIRSEEFFFVSNIVKLTINLSRNVKKRPLGLLELFLFAINQS